MITIKTPEEIEIMKEAGRILASILKQVQQAAKPGVSTLDLDTLAKSLILKQEAKHAFLGYDGFPHSLCASVNDVVVHSKPSDYVLKSGDIIGLDLGVLYKGFYSDMAVTAPVGEVSFKAKRLIDVAKKSLRLAIKKVKPGNTVGDIGNTVQRFVEDQGFSVVRDLCGHGIGRDLHEETKIPNFGQRHKGEELKEGMVICIEPMITAGDFHLKKSADGYGYASKDGSLTAHFEHTILVTAHGARILTKF